MSNSKFRIDDYVFKNYIDQWKVNSVEENKSNLFFSCVAYVYMLLFVSTYWCVYRNFLRIFQVLKNIQVMSELKRNIKFEVFVY